MIFREGGITDQPRHEGWSDDRIVNKLKAAAESELDIDIGPEEARILYQKLDYFPAGELRMLVERYRKEHQSTDTSKCRASEALKALEFYTKFVHERVQAIKEVLDLMTKQAELANSIKPSREAVHTLEKFSIEELKRFAAFGIQEQSRGYYGDQEREGTNLIQALYYIRKHKIKPTQHLPISPRIEPSSN